MGDSKVSDTQIQLCYLSRTGIIQIRMDPDYFEIKTKNER